MPYDIPIVRYELPNNEVSVSTVKILISLVGTCWNLTQPFRDSHLTDIHSWTEWKFRLLTPIAEQKALVTSFSKLLRSLCQWTTRILSVLSFLTAGIFLVETNFRNTIFQVGSVKATSVGLLVEFLWEDWWSESACEFKQIKGFQFRENWFCFLTILFLKGYTLKWKRVALTNLLSLFIVFYPHRKKTWLLVNTHKYPLNQHYFIGKKEL